MTSSDLWRQLVVKKVHFIGGTISDWKLFPTLVKIRLKTFFKMVNIRLKTFFVLDKIRLKTFPYFYIGMFSVWCCPTEIKVFSLILTNAKKVFSLILSNEEKVFSLILTNVGKSFQSDMAPPLYSQFKIEFRNRNKGHSRPLILGRWFLFHNKFVL